MSKVGISRNKIPSDQTTALIIHLNLLNEFPAIYKNKFMYWYKTYIQFSYIIYIFLEFINWDVITRLQLMENYTIEFFTCDYKTLISLKCYLLNIVIGVIGK